MIFDPILPAWRGEQHRAEGHWRDRTLLDYFDEAVARKPDAVAVVARRVEDGGETTLSWRQLKRLSDRMALGLHAHGLGRGDVLAFQLPNWWQFYCLHIACLRLGVCSNPLMPIFRERELSFMLDFADAKALVTPGVFRGHDHAAMARELRPSLPKLEHLFVIGDNFEAALLDPELEREVDAGAVFAAGRPEPDEVIQLLYTSGTTGEPKGVMHTSNTLLAMVMSYVERIGLGEDTAILMGSPLAHQTGFMYGLILSPVLGAKTCYLDIWQPEAALSLIRDEAVTFTMGATPFLADLTNSPVLDRYDISSLETFVSAGAPIPRVLVERASERLGCFVHSGWGMTENGFGSGTRKSDPPERVFGTDGCAVSCLEVRVVGEDGSPVPDEEEGRLQVRGAGQFVGYLKRPERYDTDGDGWFETGDNARMDADGYIRISGTVEGHHHPRRREHSRGRGGGAALPPSGRGGLRHRRHAGRAPGRARLRLRHAAFRRRGADLRGDVRLPAGAPAGEALPAGTPGTAGRHAAHGVREDPEIPPARTRGRPQANEGMSAPKLSRNGIAFSV